MAKRNSTGDYTLEKKDYEDIIQGALKYWNEKAIRNSDTFLCECYIESLVGFLNRHKLKVQAGRIVEHEEK